MKETSRGSVGIVIVVCILLAIVIGVIYVMSSDSSKDNMEMTNDAMMEEKNDSMIGTSSDTMKGTSSDAIMKEKDGQMMEKTSMKEDVMVKGVYETYTPEKVEDAQTEDIVLFFHASWCPFCRSADANLKGSNIPSNLTILKVDYDNSSELKKKYGVTTQHTFVQVDTKGNLITKWSGSDTVADIAAKVR